MTEWNASEYHRASSLQQALADERLARLRLEGRERVLDVGCGDGKVTAAIAARLPGGSVLGVDASREMVAFAAANYGRPNLRFEAADARRLPYRGEFDLVVSFNALHWVPEQAAALGSVRAALKPGGRALLQFVPAGPRRSLEDVIEEVRREPPWAGHFPGFRTPFVHFTPEEYQALAGQAGLRVERADVEERAWDFGSREAFAAFSTATFVEWTRHLPAGERAAFIAAVLDRYRAVAADVPAEADTFKFYQLAVALTPA